MSITETATRPSKVGLAVKMLYLVVGIGVFRTAMIVIRHADVRSPDFLISSKVVIYALSLLLIYQIGKGRNWARWSLVAIFIVNIPLTILPAFGSISVVPAQTILGFLQLGLYIFALVLLFNQDSSAWFGMVKGASRRR